MPHLHPAIVHFPVALLTLATFVAIYVLFRPSQFISDLLFWLMAAGVITSFPGIISGMAEESLLQLNPDQKKLLQIHELTGYLSVLLYTGLLFWLLVRKNLLSERELYFLAAVSVVACAILIYQGYILSPMTH